MTPTEFLLKYFDIERDRYESESDVCIAEMLYDDICDGDIDLLIDLMEKYAHYVSTGEVDFCD